MMRFLIVVLCIGVASCDSTNNPEYGALRERLFVQCMGLAKDTIKEGDNNDPHKIIYQCSMQANYMANSFGKQTISPDKKKSEQ